MLKLLSPSRYAGRVQLCIDTSETREPGVVYLSFQEDAPVFTFMVGLTPEEAREVGEQLALAAAQLEHRAEAVSA